MEINIPTKLKHDLYYQWILRVIAYMTETWVFTKVNIDKLGVDQRAIEKKIMGVTPG